MDQFGRGPFPAGARSPYPMPAPAHPQSRAGGSDGQPVGHDRGPRAAGALSGAVLGLAGGLAIAFVIYRLGHRLNLAKFFTVVGVLLMVFAAGLLANSVQNMQELGWLPVLDAPMWHSASMLSQDSAFGDVLHSFFGYSDAPTPLQLLVYVGYLAVVVVAYLGLRAGARTRPDRARPAAH